MALSIKIPDENTIKIITDHLIKEKLVNQGKKKEKVYCLTKNGDSLRLPLGFCKQAWPSLNIPTYTELDRKAFEHTIELGWSEDGIDREYQIPTYQKLSQALVDKHMAFLSLYCGGGKTIIATRAIAELGLKSGVVTDSTTIFPQWVKVLKEKTNMVVAEITSPVDVLPEADVYVFMITACTKMSPSILSPIKFLVVDEATYFMTTIRMGGLLNFTPNYILGLCAEVRREDKMHCFLPYLFGTTVIRMISSKPFTVYRMETNFKPKLVPAGYGRHGKDWNTVLNSLAENKERNDKIVDLCCSLSTGRIIVGTKRVSQVNYLYEELKKRGESVATLMKNAKTFPNCRILIGVYAKLGKGVDAKNLCEDWEGEVFNIAILGLDLGNPEQFVGRVFRHYKPIIYDIVDDYSTLRNHFDGTPSDPNKGRKSWYLARGGVIYRKLLE